MADGEECRVYEQSETGKTTEIFGDSSEYNVEGNEGCYVNKC